MTSYRPCAGCKFNGQTCAERDKVRDQIRGLGVSLVNWRCRWRQPLYRPGDAVWARLFAEIGGPYGDDAVYADFPGHVVSLHSGKVVVFVRPGAESSCGSYEFEPRQSGGFCKTGIARVSKRDAPAMNPCGDCGSFPDAHGHDDLCRRNPEFEKHWREIVA